MLSQRSLGAAGTGLVLPSDDEFNRVSSLLHFDGTINGTNNVFDDSSSSNHTITANGNVTQGSFGPFARPDGEWAVAFDGSNDYLTLPANSLDLSGNDFTIESWVFTTSTGKQNIIGATRNSDGVGSYMININRNSNQVRFFCRYNGGTVLDYNVGTGSFPLNAWTHLAVTRDGANLRVFIGGTQVGTTNTTLGSFAIDNASLNGNIYYIGTTTDGASDFLGNLSNLRVVIGTAVYTSNFTPSSSPLTAVTNTEFLGCQSNRFVDNSTSAHAITASGNPSVSAFGPFLTSEVYDAAVNGASAYFDGSSDSLTFTNDAGMSLDGDYTFELWFNASTIVLDTQHPNMIIIGTTQLFINSTSKFVSLYDSGADIVKSADNAIVTNSWYHVAAVRSGAGTNNTSLYLNGTRVAQATNTATLGASSGTGRVGSYSGTGGDFDGYISNIRLVKGTALYSGTSITIPTAPLTAVTNTKLLLNMAEGQAIDSAAQRNLSLENGTNISTAQAKFGNSSLYFDGTTDTATVIGSENVNFGTANFTVEGWIRPASFSGYKPNIISKWTNGSRGWAVRLVASGSGFVMRFTFSTDGSNDFSLDATTVLAFDTWHHFAFVQNSNTVTSYANGTANGTISCSTIFSSTNPIILGDWDTNQADYNGYIDEIRVSHTARYTSNFTPPTEPFADKGQ